MGYYFMVSLPAQTCLPQYATPHAKACVEGGGADQVFHQGMFQSHHGGVYCKEFRNNEAIWSLYLVSLGFRQLPNNPKLFIQVIVLLGPFDQVRPCLLPVAATDCSNPGTSCACWRTETKTGAEGPDEVSVGNLLNMDHRSFNAMAVDELLVGSLQWIFSDWVY